MLLSDSLLCIFQFLLFFISRKFFMQNLPLKIKYQQNLHFTCCQPPKPQASTCSNAVNVKKKNTDSKHCCSEWSSSHVSSYCLWALVAVASNPGCVCLSQHAGFVEWAVLAGDSCLWLSLGPSPWNLPLNCPHLHLVPSHDTCLRLLFPDKKIGEVACCFSPCL